DRSLPQPVKELRPWRRRSGGHRARSSAAAEKPLALAMGSVTASQEWELERALTLCRHVYNAAVGERREAWRMRGVSVTYYQQKAELPGIKEAMPEYAQLTLYGG